MKRLLILILIAALLAGCAPAVTPSPDTETRIPPTLPSTAPPAEPPTDPPTEPPKTEAQLLLESLSLEQKVGQLFIIRPDAYLHRDEAATNGKKFLTLTESMVKGMVRYPAGGFILFGDHIDTPQQTARLVSDLKLVSPIAPFIAVDEEGGTVARLANRKAFGLPRYESAGAVGASGNPEDARAMGQTIGQYLQTYGFNMDMAPVADVNTNPDNPVIGNRAFSSDPETAAYCASAMADGLRSFGITPVFKHFPGHGDTMEDSHERIAVARKTPEEMGSCEWLPFFQAGETDCIMVGHILAPQVTEDGLPAALSPAIVQGILKDTLCFRGLVITDSLSMGAITDNYPPEEAALMALEAGCDLLLMPQDFYAAFDAVVNAVRQGTYSADRLDDTVLRILQFKMDAGILVP